MSKLLAAFYGQKNVYQAKEAKPQEYTVLGVNQPLIAPEAEPVPAQRPSSLPAINDVQRKFRFSLLLNKLL